MQMKIQSISSKHGYSWAHGCGCNHMTSRISTNQEKFDYDMDKGMKKVWVRDFIWTAFYEYAFFNMVPTTKLLIG